MATSTVIQDYKTLLSNFNPANVAGISSDPNIFIVGEWTSSDDYDSTIGEIKLYNEQQIEHQEFGNYQQDTYTIEIDIHFESVSVLNDIILKLIVQEVKRIHGSNNQSASRSYDITMIAGDPYDGNYLAGVMNFIVTLYKRPEAVPT